MTGTATLELVAVFGSSGRVRVLAVLANATTPFTGYRVAKVAGVQPIKAVAELRRLAAAGIVQQVPGRPGSARWVLTDPDLRTFFQRRVRLSWWDDWRRDSRARARRAELAVAGIGPWDFSRYRPNRSAVSNPEEFVRRPGKDRELARLDLRTRPPDRRRGRR
ncbi:MAG: hypothetical protein L3J91_06845 [Thermoplasmata archaeon]|nr:hypothetical protein [Thermoplasmata archaeon]